MAKGQKRSTREPRKPKKPVVKSAPAPSGVSLTGKRP